MEFSGRLAIPHEADISGREHVSSKLAIALGSVYPPIDLELISKSSSPAGIHGHLPTANGGRLTGKARTEGSWAKGGKKT